MLPYGKIKLSKNDSKKYLATYYQPVFSSDIYLAS